MSLLGALWFASLLLSALAIAVMGAIVVHRLYANRTAKAQTERRNALIPAVLDIVGQTDPPGRLEQIRGDRDRHLLGSIGLEFLDLVKGGGRSRMIALLEANGVVGVSLTELAHAPAMRRIDLVTLLAFFDNEAVRTALRSVLEHDPVQAVRITAAIGLVRMAGPPPLDELVTALRITPQHTSRRLSTFFCAYAATFPAEMLEFARRIRDPLLMTFALDGLTQAGNHDVLPLVTALTGHFDMDVRVEAYRSLAHLGHPSALEAVRRGLADAAWPVRAQAAMCVGRIGLSALADELSVLLEDRAWWVRYRAAAALLQLGDAGRSRLRNASTKPDRAGRIAQLILQERPS